MKQYLIDTNVVSDYFFATLPAAGMEFMDTVIDATSNLSIITQIELLCWKTDADTEQKVKDFIADSVVLDITPGVILYCVSLRRNKKVKLADAIIAATALASNYILVTNNEKDFINIKGLSIINPYKI